MERDPLLVLEKLELQEIQQYGEENSIPMFVRDANKLEKYKKEGLYDSMWSLAFNAPHRFGSVGEKSFLVILDEFQNLNGFIYRDQECNRSLDETIPGSYHEVAESKVAPMLVTGSQVRWLINVVAQYLQMGRLKKMKFSPYLDSDEGLKAVYQYANYYEVPITNQTALQINESCYSDPFFISCVVNSNISERNLTTRQGVIDTIEYEVGDSYAELAQEWVSWLDIALDRMNEHHAKNIFLFLTKNHHRIYTPQELKKELNLEMDT